MVLVDDLEQAADFSNAFGPEHLEIQVRDADAVLARIENAGAIFIGPYSPVSLGDYAAGSNHVLPTGGQARSAAGLSAATFLRPQQVVRYDERALREVAPVIAALSAEEDLRRTARPSRRASNADVGPEASVGTPPWCGSRRPRRTRPAPIGPR